MEAGMFVKIIIYAALGTKCFSCIIKGYVFLNLNPTSYQRRSPLSALRSPSSVFRSPFSVFRSPFSALRSNLLLYINCIVSHSAIQVNSCQEQTFINNFNYFSEIFFAVNWYSVGFCNDVSFTNSCISEFSGRN